MIKRLSNYSFDWKLSLFTFMLFPILITLGNWQLSREEEKLTLKRIYADRQMSSPIDISKINVDQDLQYVKVQLIGKYDNEHSFLLDNKLDAGRAGFELITPFITEQNTLYFINRGWVAQGRYRSDLPNIDSVIGLVTLTAEIYVPMGKLIMLGKQEETIQWPKIIQSLEPDQMIQLILGNNKIDKGMYFPYSLRLAANTPGVVKRNWALISTTPEKHRGYAMQWFVMAGVLLMLYIVASTKMEEE